MVASTTATNPERTGNSSSSALSVVTKVLRSAGELPSLEQEWICWQRHPNCDFHFYQTVIESLTSAIRPHIIVAYRDGVPVGMLVGRLDKSSVDLSVGYKRLVGVPARSLTLLHGGWVGEKSAEVAEAFAKSIQQSLEAREADFAYFNHLRTDGELYRIVSQLAQDGSQGAIGLQRNHRGMNLYSTAAEFVKHLGTKERNNQKRRTRKLEEDFGDRAQVKSFGSVIDLDVLIRDVDQIAKKTYQRALGVGFEDNPDTRNRMTTEAGRGWLRGYVLYLDAAPVAFWLGSCYGTTFYSGFTGYDPAYGKYSPGMFLLIKALGEICEQNSDGVLKIADFGLGDAEWKQVIGDLEWADVPVWIFAPSAKGSLLRSIRAASGLLDGAARATLRRLNLVARVKKVWRKSLGGN